MAPLRIPREMVDELVAHARAEAPNEACGVVGVSEGAAVAFYRAVNSEASPLRFNIDSADLIRIWNETQSRKQEMALYHSHTKSAAYPSQTDINKARDWPGSPWLIVSLADAEAPEVRVFEIADDQVTEIELIVE